MVPTPRSYPGSSSNGRSSKATLEIIPDTRFIVFAGGEHEAQSIKLTGVVRFTATEPMSILRPKVRLEGKRRISWWYMGGMSAGEVTDKRVFWNQEQKLGIESSHKVKAGSIEWPFEFELSPSMPESVEGLKETFIVYHLHASVSRPGWNAKDLVAQEHIRIVRTLGADSMEMTRSRVNADIWANKISYSISIPSDAIVFGTSITADVELSPLKKGLKLGKVELRLVETTVKRIQASEVPDTRGDRTKSEESEVAKSEMEFPEESKVSYEDETVDNPTLADEMYRFKATLPLPKSLHACRQDVDSHQINISHRFKLMVNIHNPEGHISQLVCRLPVKLFISPNLPVDEANEVTGVMNGVTDVELNSNETSLTAPPEYGRHQLDQIFSDIDPAGYMSRATSAPGTPGGLNALSRRGSDDNLPSLNGMNGHVSPTEGQHGSATPSILHSRLADLQERNSSHAFRSAGHSSNHSPSGGTSPAPGMLDNSYPGDIGFHHPTPPSQNSYFSNAAAAAANGQSPHHSSSSPSRRTSAETPPTNFHTSNSDYNLQDLSRVPSYTSAVRTPGAITPFTAAPPSYETATSRPPSPLQRPGQAHVRTSGTSTPNSNSSQQTLNATMASLQMSGLAQASQVQGAQAPQPAIVHRLGGVSEDEARLRMLRARS
ncbi:hypothetical protein B0A48_05445 [Cryoendolithus antarcticus]|uniref:Arrestin C-terminal-like domain-containing protein n=1 Tax=Cryoendolithus antarcticus TaxID=1507870 RepID=A0A1V8TII8_9PEZI|nr:hypothetical protein B0A48_05445 [Cryoendolithus antarcticus]